MRISWNWLREFIYLDLPAVEVAAVLTSTGLEVESVEAIEPVKGMLSGVVVGHVRQVAKHPDADRLTVCQVDLGNGAPVAIVCGAPNVAEGQKVLVATAGSTLTMRDGSRTTIKKTKIRGVESNGMICAEDELGLGESHDGIMVLDASARTGMPAAELLGLKSDMAFEIGLTPNRADAMSHLGVARDLAAALNYRNGSALRVTPPSVDAFAVDDTALLIPVEVRAPHACPRYAGLTFTQVKVGPSPAWLQDRLKSIGLKPINNVVDVTNFVQHELGQPLHAFDAAQLRGGKIIVQHLPDGTRFTTLDGKERTLSSDDLMICDAEGGSCIAGVFGGLNSGVTDATTTIFLESACFDPASVRRTARRHGLNTDASFRFERGVDPEITVMALKRAAVLLKEVSGARVSSSIVDITPNAIAWKRITLDFARMDRLAGDHIEHDAVVRILEALDFKVEERNAKGLVVSVPPYRVDVHREADVVEEVLRIHGYDRIAAPEQLLCPPMREPALTLERLQRDLGAHLSARGFSEILTPSLVNGGLAVKTHAIAERDAVHLKNPLSAELDTLRPTMLFGGLQAIAYNSNRQHGDLRLFERGRVYAISKGAVKEADHTALWITGRRSRERWRSDDAATATIDLKAELELLLERCAIKGATFDPAPHPLLHEAIDLRGEQGLLGFAGQVGDPVLAAFDIQHPVYFCEIMDQAWLERCGRRRPSMLKCRASRPSAAT
jgi:phenylalanyl-tRNA synthetase beta chain